MAYIVLLFILKGRDCMSKVLIEVLVIILIAGSYLILYSAVRVSAIADQRIAEIRSRETFDKEKQLKTNQSSILGGIAMANKEKMIEGRLVYPQCYAAVAGMLPTFGKKALVIDVGSWTVDSMLIANKKPDNSKCDTQNEGLIKCMRAINRVAVQVKNGLSTLF